MNPQSEYKDGLFRHNSVLYEGMVIAPIVICCDTLKKSLILSLAFALITVTALMIGSLYPRKLPYAVRIILYALTASAVYIPTALLCEYISPSTYGALTNMVLPGQGMVSGAAFLYLPLLSVNSFVVLHSELHFYRYKRKTMFATLLAHAAGFALAACLVGFLREIAAHGTVMGYAVDMPLVMSGTAAPWGGFILIGILAALHRRVFRNKAEE